MTATLRPEQRHLRTLISSLSSTPGDQELRELVGAIADAVEGKRYPRKAIGALVRNHGGEFAPRLRSRITEMAAEEVAVRAQKCVPESASAPTASWLSVKDAAALLGIHATTLESRLRTRDGRRRLGWPQWDGSRWRIAPQAIDPATSAVFLSGLPTAEPLADLLPSWCEQHCRALG